MSYSGIADESPMIDPEYALNRLIRALQAHFDAARSGGDGSPALDSADDMLRDAFFAYDTALHDTYGVDIPLDVFADDEDDEDDFDDYDDIDDDDDDLDDDEDADDDEYDYYLVDDDEDEDFDR